MTLSVSRCIFVGLLILLSLPTAVLTQGGSTTKTPSVALASATLSPITTGTVIRPSNGETITLYETAQIYTVSWSPPPLSGPIGIEIWGYDDVTAQNVFGEATNSSCSGWLVNEFCAKVGGHLSNGSTSFGVFIPNSSEILGAQPYTQFYSFWLGVYLDVIHTWEEADDSSPWYLRSSNFTVEYPGFLKTTSTHPPQASEMTTSSFYPMGTVTGAITGTSAAKSTGATTSASSKIGFRGTLLALSTVWLVAGVFLSC